MGHIPSPCPSPEGERLSFAIKAHDGRGDRMRTMNPAIAIVPRAADKRNDPEAEQYQ
jgi:hypothetical protein